MSTTIPNTRDLARRVRRPRRGFGARISTLFEIGRHFSGTKRLFLMPMIVIFLLASAALVVVSIIEYAAPFVYTLF